MMVAKISSEDIALLVTCAWAMWGNRNSVRNGGTRKEGSEILQWAMHYLDEYQVAVDSIPNASEPVQHVTRWNPPQAPCFKFNVDGALFPELHSMGVGILVRDWSGQFVAATCKLIHAPLGPLEVEAKAVEVGLQFAKLLGVSDLIVEGDSLIVSRALSHSSSALASIDTVIMGIRSATLEFHNVVFSHVKRNANSPAHLLAKYAKGIVNQCIWMESCPTFLELAILHDVNSAVI
nr:hypothetical protein CFP56_10643 [Quercus suber]